MPRTTVNINDVHVNWKHIPLTSMHVRMQATSVPVGFSMHLLILQFCLTRT